MALLDMMKPLTDQIGKVEKQLLTHMTINAITLNKLWRKSYNQTILNWLLVMWPALLLVLDKWIFR